MEVSRLNKQVSFEAGKMTWRQKLRAIFAMEREMTNSSSIDDTDASAKYDSNEGLTEEEREKKKQKDEEKKAEDEIRMKEVVKTVDNAKIDSSSFNGKLILFIPAKERNQHVIWMESRYSNSLGLCQKRTFFILGLKCLAVFESRL